MTTSTGSTVTPALPAYDLRRVIARQTWLANRARNALQRPAFIGAISVATFVTALVSLVVVPRSQRDAVPRIPVVTRPDTLAVVASRDLARTRLAQSESALVAAREYSTSPAEPLATDSLGGMDPRRDTLMAHARTLERLLSRAEQAPLPSSYRALAELPELRSDTRVRALIDSLADVERERDGIGAVGGVDPIFVALTSRANEIGRAIRSIASERLSVIQTELAGVEAPTPAVDETPVADTAAPLAVRDSARAAMQQAIDSLTQLRATSQALDLAEDRARERANAVAPPLALLASAFVLSAVIGFAAAFVGEMRRPRVSDAAELERFLGVRVLSTVETPMPNAERGRREADRMAPPYFDPGAEGYQLAYLGLATEHPALLSATITGDEMAVASVVACNLAAIAAEEARSTLVLDLEPTCSASAALRARVSPGIVDVLQRGTSWADARVAARVGREKTVDLVPFGVAATRPPGEELNAILRRDAGRLARYYDAILVLAASEDVANGLPSTLPAPDVVYCAQPGVTPLRHLRDQLERIRASGGMVRGVVLWNAARPLLPTPRELASKKVKHPRKEAAAVA